MKSAGIDIGSRTVKLAVVDDGELILTRRSLTSHDPRETIRELIHGIEYHTIVATGYGRHLIQDVFGCAVISEIKAFALGARAILPRCRLIPVLICVQPGTNDMHDNK